MSATQRARSGVPLATRSVLPTVPGIPAWGAVALAVGATFLGFALDAIRGSELTSAFSVFYVLGCVGAVLAVRHRGLFTTMVQPPLLLVVAVPLAYQRLSAGSGGGMKDLILNAAIPLVNRFPLMLLTTLAVVVIGVGRIYLSRQDGKLAARPRRKSATEGRPDRSARTSPGRTAEVRRPARSGAHTTSRFPRRSVAPDHQRAAELTQPAPLSAAPIRQSRPESVRRPVSAPHDGNLSRRPDRGQAPNHGQAPDRGQAPVRTPQFGRPPEPEMPRHPIPQVRYRDRDTDRHEAPTDQPRPTR